MSDQPSPYLKTKIYRLCEDKCDRCRACREFAKVLRETDLGKRSDMDRQRDAEIRRIDR